VSPNTIHILRLHLTNLNGRSIPSMVFQNKCLAKNIPNEEEASGPETESEVLLNFRMLQIVRAKFFALTIGKKNVQSTCDEFWCYCFSTCRGQFWLIDKMLLIQKPRKSTPFCEENLLIEIVNLYLQSLTSSRSWITHPKNSLRHKLCHISGTTILLSYVFLQTRSKDNKDSKSTGKTGLNEYSVETSPSVNDPARIRNTAHAQTISFK
jgi:hypothetical protein